ncbi:MAG TPA: quinolinate synthase, partial [Porphyromonadaceae bacterium]|nr:quinolinate synthase [Porphyromonadaceae bacterium]
NMLLWQGACHVHEQFSIERILTLKKEYPQALLLSHPECPKYLLEISDHVGSTSSIIKYAAKSDAKQFIVATEAGILHQMQKENPDK